MARAEAPHPYPSKAIPLRALEEEDYAEAISVHLSDRDARNTTSRRVEFRVARRDMTRHVKQPRTNALAPRRRDQGRRKWENLFGLIVFLFFTEASGEGVQWPMVKQLTIYIYILT